MISEAYTVSGRIRTIDHKLVTVQKMTKSPMFSEVAVPVIDLTVDYTDAAIIEYSKTASARCLAHGNDVLIAILVNLGELS
jgi:hypothetical protein